MTKTSPTQHLRTLAGWMSQAVVAGEPISIDQVRSWKSVLNLAADTLEASETVERVTEARRATVKDRVPEAYALELVVAANKAVGRLAIHAMQAATAKEVFEIDRDASNIVSAFELLLVGVTRLPSFNDENTGA